MKIQSPSPLFNTLDRVRGSESSGDAPKREREEDQHPKKEEREASFAEVENAVAELSRDESVTMNGLQAEVVGNGPGLRVTLKDGKGALVRQFTGEEFLKLREAAAGAGRGRLLDKKL